MIKSVIVKTRPSKDIPWYITSSISDEYIYFVYILSTDTKYFLGQSIKESQDGLTRTSTVIWSSEKDRETYYNDPVLVNEYFEPKNQYQTANGIVETLFSLETVNIIDATLGVYRTILSDGTVIEHYPQ